MEVKHVDLLMRPLTAHLLAIASKMLLEHGVDSRSLLALCAPELLHDLGEECGYALRMAYGGMVLHTPSGPLRVQEDHSMNENEGIVVYRRVGHVPVQTAKVSL